MRKGLLIFFVFLLLPFVFGLTVTLNSPSNGNTSSSSSMTFNCSVSDTVDISSVKLFTDISGSWAQTGSTVSGNVTSAEFAVSSLSSGTYTWNCLAENVNATTAYASSNYTFTVSVVNFSGTIPNQTWAEDTINANAFDLDSYFSGVGTYTVSGNSTINVTIDSDHRVTFMPPANWTGTQTVTFSGGGYTSNNVLLNVTAVNDPPYLVGNVSNQSTSRDTNFTLDMTDFFAERDANDPMNYTIIADHFTSYQDGDDLIIDPASDFEGSEEVRLNATDGNYSALSNAFTITVGGGNSAPTIDSYAPSTNPTLEVNGTQEFTVSYSDADDDAVTVAWYVDDVSQRDTDSEYTFTATALGAFSVKVVVSDGELEDSQSWTVVVGTGEFVEEAVSVTSLLGEPTSVATCGNGVIEDGETCSSCALDVACGEGFVCQDSVCVEKKGAGLALIMFLVIAALVIAAGILIYYYTTARKRTAEHGSFKYRAPSMKQEPPSEYTDFYQGKK